MHAGALRLMLSRVRAPKVHALLTIQQGFNAHPHINLQDSALAAAATRRRCESTGTRLLLPHILDAGRLLHNACLLL
jgi:hypothetical protein